MIVNGVILKRIRLHFGGVIIDDDLDVFSASITDTAFQSICSRLVFIYYFAKPGKVKQVRLGYLRVKIFLEDTVIKLTCIKSETF